ncbi:MAG: hypothetical protein KGM42_11825 [Hyphomicrobiales bacterium]|nr:hypothetical protein [Hyphomicrobiales bacterium]
MRLALRTGFAAAGLLWLTPTIHAEQGETKIELGFVLAWDELKPAVRKGRLTAYSAELTLNGNQVWEHWSRHDARSANAPYFDDEGGLGSAWRVVSASEIRGAWRVGNYYKFITVKVSGAKCSVAYTTQLLDGETQYTTKSGGVTRTFSRPRMIDPYCRIK